MNACSSSNDSFIGTACEWTESAERAVDGDDGDDGRGYGRLARAEPEGGPEQAGHQDECQRIVRPGRRATNRTRPTTPRRGTPPTPRSRFLDAGASVRGWPAPQEYHWRHDQGPDGIAEPPGEPDRPRVAGRREARHHQRRHTDAGGDRGCTDRGERKPNDIRRAIERGNAVRVSAHKPRAREGLEGVAERNGRRGGNRARRAEVNQESASGYGRPRPRAEHQQGGDRDAGRWPHGTRTRVHECE